MSAEIQVSLSLVARKGGTLAGLDLGALSITWTGNNSLHNRQTVGTVEEALVLGDCGAGGFLIMVNRSASNYVKVRPSSGVADLVRLRAGEGACFRLDAGATAPFVIADTAACELEYVLLED